MTIILHILFLLFLFYFLAIVCDTIFVPSLENIAKRWNMSAEFAGATLMAIGSSAPELFTSIFSLMKGGAIISMGAGTIVGSALFNILVIIGATAMISKIKLSWKPVIRDLGMYIVAILLLLFTFMDGKIVFWEVSLYILFYIFYIFIAKNWQKWFNYKDNISNDDGQSKLSFIEYYLNKILVSWIPDGRMKPYFVFFISIIVIGISTHFMVDSAVIVAYNFGMSSALIGLTVLAIGTSIPDLISSIVVAKKGQGDMAVANGIGSNIFDILFGLGFPYMLYLFIYDKNFIEVSNENLFGSIILLFATVIVILFVLIAKKWNLTKMSGIILILLYIIYIIWQVYISY